MVREKKRIKIKKNDGITLVALVVSIIVLILLAGASINLVIGNNGIMQKAAKGKEDYAGAAINEQMSLNKIEDYIGNESSELVSIEEAKQKGILNEKTSVIDTNGNIIRVPQGFKIAKDSGANVTEGIVIEDNDIIEGVGNNRGNQYVWIPVGNGIKKSDGTTVNITLGRYAFNSNGTPELKQDAANYEQEVKINSCYKELSMARIGTVDSNNHLNDTNTTALDLEEFIESAKVNGGYYIARYEASWGIDKKANSKVSNSYAVDSKIEKEGQLWNRITQIDAATASRNLYSTVKSDLTNSYAWDTAIVYIQNFSEDADYSRQTSLNTSLANTGTNNDERCKINDMSSNLREWNTEFSTIVSDSFAFVCGARGGEYSNSTYYVGDRGSARAMVSGNNISFRTIVYM